MSRCDVMCRYGKIISTKAIIDQTTSRCKGIDDLYVTYIYFYNGPPPRAYILLTYDN